MATRSFIGYMDDDNMVNYVYCHFDSYPSYVGQLLLNIYNTKEKIEELISIGDIHFLDKKLYPEPNKPHNAEEKQEGVTLFYNRDLNEKDLGTYIAIKEDYLEYDDVSYLYLFENGTWYYKPVWSKFRKNSKK